jgi:cytochrome c oxidase assembly protein subunit 15/protoheme IX farnesyltransferase
VNRYAKFAWLTLGWTVIVILWGAFVRATGSGAGCGSHWPLCNGEVIPRDPAIETLIEMTHRLTSGVDLLLVLGLLIFAYRLYPKGSLVRKGATGSAAFILLEALLGAGLVLFELTADNDSAARAVMIAIHLLNTFILLAWITLTAWWASGGRGLTLRNKGFWPWLVGIGAVSIALLGMSGAITALGDTLFPSTSIASSLAEQANPESHFLVQLRIYHPIIAVLVGMGGLYILRAIYTCFTQPTARRLTLALGALVFIQWGLGLANVILLAPAWLQLIHLLTADIVWITFILLSATILAVESPS